jgi:hypothetical protein
MDFCNLNNGMLIADGIIIHSENGGETWIKDSAFVLLGRQCKFITAHNGLILNGEGRLYKFSMLQYAKILIDQSSKRLQQNLKIFSLGKGRYKIQINHSSNEPIVLGIYSLQGKLFYSRSYCTFDRNNKEVKLEISRIHFPSGMYILRVNADRQILNGKIVIPRE